MHIAQRLERYSIKASGRVFDSPCASMKGVLQKDGTYSFPFNISCMDCGKNCDRSDEYSIDGGKIDWWCYCPDCDKETFHPCSGYLTEDASDI